MYRQLGSVRWTARLCVRFDAETVASPSSADEMWQCRKKCHRLLLGSRQHGSMDIVMVA